MAELTAQLSETLRERDALRSGELQAANSLCTMGPGSGGDGANGGAQRQGTDPLHASEACSDAQAGAASHVCLTLTLKAGMPEVALTPADLAAMPAGTLSSHFCTLVKELAKTVVDAAGTSEGEERVRQLIEQALALWSCAGQHNPSAMKQFLTTKLDEGHKGGPADERTPQIVRVLGLSDLQKKELCNLRRLFVQRMAAIANGRSSMASPVIGAPAVCGTSGRAMASQQLAARQAARHVTNALHEEHTTALEFENAVTRHVLAPAQVAQLLIQSYPWPPDCLSVATWVAAESGDAEALAALASEAQARNAAAAAAASGKVLPTDASFSAFVTPFLNGGMVPVGIGLQGGCTSSANTAVGGPVPLF